jgi:hypothetical protein
MDKCLLKTNFVQRRPSTLRTDENLDNINALVREDHRRTIDQLGKKIEGDYPE